MTGVGKWCSKDVRWYSQRYKKPVAYSTVADSDALSTINQPNRTASELMSLLGSGKFLVSQEMVKVIQAYLDRGLRDEIIITRPG